ncbi:MAG: DUF4402 domain-containing protein [Bacillota bacterium]
MLTAVWLASAPAVYAATATATATASVWAALTITKSTDLSFGVVSVGTTGGTVVVDTAGARTTTGDVVAEGGTVSAASFSLTGEPSKTYTVTLPTSASITYTDAAGTVYSMTVDTFTSSSASGTYTLDASGNDTLYVGATLNVAGSQQKGDYSGTFDVTVEYQ